MTQARIAPQVTLPEATRRRHRATDQRQREVAIRWTQIERMQRRGAILGSTPGAPSQRGSSR